MGTKERISKKILCLGVFGLFLGIAIQAHALPTLFFDGELEYTSIDGLLKVDASLTGFEDLPSAPVLGGSSLVFQARLTNIVSDAFITTGIFGTAPANPDIMIVGGDSSNLLEGEFLEAIMRGGNSLDSGIFSGQFTPTGGGLLSVFTSPSDTVSLILNLDPTTFSSTMFDSDFSGQIDGRMSSALPVPEPATWMLLGLGITAFLAVCKRKMACNK